MGLQDFGTMDANASLKQVVEELANLMDTLNFLLNGNLDVKNLRANSITADRLKASTITAREILANSITADKMDVTELSAITANMGTITAGSITTNAEINVGTDVTIGNNLNLGESDYTGSKEITWSTDSGISANLSVLSGDMSINVDGFITLTISSSQGLVVNKKVDAPTFDASVGMNIDGQPVATKTYVLGAISGKVDSGSSTSTAPTHDHGIPTGTLLAISGGGSVAWTPSGSHSHTV